MSDIDDMLEDAVEGVRGIIEIVIPPDFDTSRFPEAVRIHWRDRDWLVLPFVHGDEFTLDVFGYNSEGGEMMRFTRTLLS